MEFVVKRTDIYHPDPELLRLGNAVRTREEGFVNREENIAGLHAIGIAATEQSREVVGGFSITGSKHSLLGQQREREMAQAAIELIDEYELELLLSSDGSGRWHDQGSIDSAFGM